MKVYILLTWDPYDTDRGEIKGVYESPEKAYEAALKEFWLDHDSRPFTLDKNDRFWWRGGEIVGREVQ